MNSLKIVHCSTFVEFRNGYVFYSMDRKITHGLIQNGHMVYNFSFRDNAKINRPLGIFKSLGVKKMNQNLIKTCINIRPDILLLGKAEMIEVETITEIKRLIPNIKIIQWFVDFLSSEKPMFFDRFNLIDAFFQTNATKLKELSYKYPNTLFSYMPNIADPAFENIKDTKKKYDIIYIARDKKEDARAQFSVLLKEFCEQNNLTVKMYGSAGNPGIFGDAYQQAIAQAKIAINFNRKDKVFDGPDSRVLGSSDRMNHFMGCGTCTFSPRIKGLDKLYKEHEHVVYFNDAEDCFEKIIYYLKNNNYESVASKGQQNAFKVSNAKRVTKFILQTALNMRFDEKYEWDNEIYYKGKTWAIN